MTQMNQNGVCLLCGNRAKLLKKSHIIPNFMYKGLKDDLNRMLLVNFNSPKDQVRYEQTGYYDRYVLCSKCDNERLSKLEKYADLLLFGSKASSPLKFQKAIGHDGIKSIIIENVDFRKLKLFILSILWRAHISKHTFFNNIDVKESEEKLRYLLLEELELEEDEFKISIVALQAKKDRVRAVLKPRIILIGSGEVAVFFINGVFYFIDLIPRSDFSLFSQHYLKFKEKFEIMLLDKDKAASFMASFGLPEYFINFHFS